MTATTFDRRTQAFVVLVVLALILLLTLNSSQWHSGLRAGRTSVDVDVAAAEPLLLEGSSRSRLRPGAVRPLDLSMTNPNDRIVVLTDLIVTVSVIDAPHATPTRPCTLADFHATPSRLDGLVLGPRAATTLRAAGIDQDRWPTVSMTNTDHNQDGCRSASLTLSLQAIGYFA